MSDEYEYGPWIGWNGGDRPVSTVTMVERCLRRGGASIPVPAGACRWTHCEFAPGGDIIAYRIATPKPKRELVVGKWYRLIGGTWSKAIAIDDAGAWLSVSGTDVARFWPNASIRHGIDWSTPPRDEAPE